MKTTFLADCLGSPRKIVDELRSIPGVRSPWVHRGYVYVPVDRRRWGEFLRCVSAGDWVVDRRDVSSVVLRSRECLSDFWHQRNLAVEDAAFARRVQERQYRRIQQLLAAHPVGLSDAESVSSSHRLELLISDDERCRIEDDFDRFGGSVEDTYKYYPEDFGSSDVGVNKRISDYRWRKYLENPP